MMGGRFGLFVDSENDIETKHMVYTSQLIATNGDVFFSKVIKLSNEIILGIFGTIPQHSTQQFIKENLKRAKFWERGLYILLLKNLQQIAIS
jgi:hypothetical protein